MYHDQDLRKFKVFVVQSLSHLELFETPLTAAHQGLLFFTISWSYSNSCPLSWWYHLTISSSATLFSFCLQSCRVFSNIRIFSSESAVHIRWPKYWSVSIHPSSEYAGWFPLRLIGLISLLSKGLLSIFCSTTIWKHQFFSTQPSLWSNSYILTWQLEKPYAV